MSSDFTFDGWRRPDGRIGVRNHCLVLATVVCAAPVAREIGRRLPEVVTVEHPHGCGRGGPDIGLQLRTLAGLVNNPNIGGTILVGLGCEAVSVGLLSAVIGETGKPLKGVIIQESGGSGKTTDQVEAMAREMLAELAGMPRSPATAADLTLALECGGSDTFSGMTANPAVGRAVDRLVALGGTAILSETTEMIGAVGPLQRRAANDEIAAQLKNLIDGQEALTRKILGDFADRALAPGNVDSGLSTIAEKSLGCIAKAGSTPIRELLPYAQRPSQRGLVVMDTPGYDAESMTGMAAAGAQVIAFTTGRGSPAGFPGVPVIKVSSNSETYRRMTGDIDIDAGRVLSGMTLADVGEEILSLLLRVCRGEKTKAEVNRQDVFAIAQTHQAL
ncbi:MAG: UxaA family hydrolase [Dehalococcoidia bacterium]|jgi:altronate dehydratase large subunit